jgi:hypothetical protein
MELDRAPYSSRLAGIATTAELLAAGVTPAAIRALVRRGELLPVGRGVYARAADAARLTATERGARALRLAAAVAVAGPGAVGSHSDAAVIHELAQLDRPPADMISLTRPPDAAGGRNRRPGIRVRPAALPQGQVSIMASVPVTSVARTVVDLARTTSFRSGVVVADSALHGGKTSKAELAVVLEACPRWPGISKARQVIEFADARAESPFESISRVAFRDGGLPAPDLQVWVGDDGGSIGRVDFLWREYRTVAEADGALKYADPDRARRQLRRDAELRRAGFEVVHFSWRELIATPDLVVQSIRAAFARAEALRAAGWQARQES